MVSGVIIIVLTVLFPYFRPQDEFGAGGRQHGANPVVDGPWVWSVAPERGKAAALCTSACVAHASKPRRSRSLAHTLDGHGTAPLLSPSTGAVSGRGAEALAGPDHPGPAVCRRPGAMVRRPPPPPLAANAPVARRQQLLAGPTLLLPDPPHPSCRAEALDRFAVINVQYQHLLDALRPMLRQFAAYPRSVNQVRACMRACLRGACLRACSVCLCISW